MNERCVLDLLNTDYVADLRAEIVKWWEDLCQVYLLCFGRVLTKLLMIVAEEC